LSATAATIEKPRKVDDGTAIDFATLLELGKNTASSSSRRCNAAAAMAAEPRTLGRGATREVLKLAGNVDNVMRVYANGFHNKRPQTIVPVIGKLHPGDG